MKHFYLLILLLASTFLCAQDAQTSGDIDGLKLYPNPVTQGKVFIHTTLNAPKKILIFNVFGTRVLETTILGKELDLRDLDSGVYLLRVFEHDKVATRKLIVK